MATWFYKWFFILLLPAHIYTGGKINEDDLKFPLHVVSRMLSKAEVHPLHISVTEINHNAADKTLEISCKLFTDDFEKVLAQNYKTKVDLINPADRTAMEKLVNDFIQKHLLIKADGKQVKLSYIGYEKDNDAIYSFFQADSIATVKKLEINNNILHELFTDQINLMHVIVGGKRKSMKLDYPEKEAEINF
ncbi:MAG: DUF6702 family protein [Chitinophagaceae bacterium]